MKLLLSVFTLSVAAAPADATCSTVLAQFERALATSAIGMSEVDSGTDCVTHLDEVLDEPQDLFGMRDKVSSQRGKVGKRTVTVIGSGPHGSGRYWHHRIKTLYRGKMLSACINTSTGGFRNWAGRTPRWQVFEKGRVVLWDSASNGSSTSSDIIYPIHYKLNGRRVKVDQRRTRKSYAAFARFYQRMAKERDNPNRALHQMAATALSAAARGSKCPAQLTPKTP